MNLSCLAEHQLLAIYQKRESEREGIEKEWFHRYAVPFPFKLNIRCQILNVMDDKVIDDNLAPEEVFKHAERLRERLLFKKSNKL